ncbi:MULTISPECIES: hypothetical protein [unclassified Empedobacter]|uniref:hypothetical protein n=1 Tax=unclassified Empedobacter TaxID=2643773 RepID=UPI0025B97532|nr:MULTISPECIES: hypothetical protein [unclassified Empedobacter]
MPSALFIYKNTNLAKQFVKHFRLNGYSLYEFYDESIPYYEFSGLQRLENIFYRVIKKDTQHIHKINHRNFINLTNRKLKQLKQQNLKFDYCFVIRGDLIPENVLEYARSVSTKMIDYQLDGLAVSEKILEYNNLFDQIYVFDEQDVVDYPNYNLKAITNCFFEEENTTEKSIDFSYIGVNTENRFDILSDFHDVLKRINQDSKINFYLKQDEFHAKFSDKLIMLNKPFTYQECLEISNESKILIDLKREEHDGLSLRFFEAMNYNNKIITNNKSVAKYDFYNPNNIFITDFKNLEGLESFIQKPFIKISDEIINQYNFKYWINRIFST